jgi:hypothetical protein
LQEQKESFLLRVGWQADSSWSGGTGLLFFAPRRRHRLAAVSMMRCDRSDADLPKRERN